MSSSHQFVELRASQAGHLACFANRAGEPLGERNRLRFSGFRSRCRKLRLSSSVVLSSVALHKLSCSHNTRQAESWPRDEQRQCEHPRTVAYSSAHQQPFEDFRTSTAAQIFLRSKETPRDGGLSYAFDDTFAAALRLLPQSLTARSAECPAGGWPGRGAARVWPNRGTTRGQICPKAEYVPFERNADFHQALTARRASAGPARSPQADEVCERLTTPVRAFCQNSTRCRRHRAEDR
jgi:hypothetical protein